MRAVLPEVTQVWKNEGATLDRKVMVRIIIIVIVSAEGAKTPSILVGLPYMVYAIAIIINLIAQV